MLILLPIISKPHDERIHPLLIKTIKINKKIQEILNMPSEM